jgi:hypothetical protein
MPPPGNYPCRPTPARTGFRRAATPPPNPGRARTCYRGEKLGAKLAAQFESVTAQRVRLNITEAADGPTLWEFQVFK